MKVLVLYATTEGQTRKVASYVADRLRQAGDSVTLMDATAVQWDFWLGEFDAAVLAASIHANQYQSSIIQFARHHYERLNQIPSLFISVSLSAAEQDAEGLKSIAACADRFTRETGWKADVRHVAGAFRFTEYDFFKRWVMHLIAWEKGVKGGAAQSDLELTDWAQVDEIAASFHKRASTRSKARAVQTEGGT